MATLEELIQIRTDLTTANGKRAHLVFISRDMRLDQPYNTHRAEITEPISNAFIQLFEYHLNRLIESDPMLVPYDINLDTNECTQYIPANDVINAATINNGVINLLNAPEIREMDDEFFKNLWAYAVKIEYGNQHIIYYRKYGNGKVLKRGTFDGLLFHGGRFSQIESNVFQMDNKIDAFYSHDEFIILQHTNFERLFGFEDQYESASATALEQIAATHNFVDIDLLTTFVGTDSKKRRKLAAISRNQLIVSMGFDQISRTIQEYGLTINIDNQTRRFEITKKNAFMFLKALNDDYLRSDATANRYEASSKRRSR